MKLSIYIHVLSALTVISYSSKVKSISLDVGEILQKNESDKNVKDIMTNLQKNFKRAATMGIVIGTTRTARKMEANILQIIHELIKTIQGINMKQAVEKYQKIQTTIDRDKKAMEILTSAMNVALKSKSISEYRQALQKISNKGSMSKNPQPLKQLPKDKRELMKLAQRDVKSHLQFLRKSINATVHETITHMQQHKKKSEISSTPPAITSSIDSHVNDIFKHETYNLPLLYIRMPIWPIHQSNVESFYRFRRQNSDVSNAIDDDGQKENDEKVQGENDDEDDFGGDGFDAPEVGGGLAGLIAGLSGGEGGK